VVERAGEQRHAVSDADVLRALADCPEKDLWRGRVRVFRQEVVLHLPHVIEPHLVGELYLVESLMVGVVLFVLVPGLLHLEFVYDPELHGAVLSRFSTYRLVSYVVYAASSWVSSIR